MWSNDRIEFKVDSENSIASRQALEGKTTTVSPKQRTDEEHLTSTNFEAVTTFRFVIKNQHMENY